MSTTGPSNPANLPPADPTTSYAERVTNYVNKNAKQSAEDVPASKHVFMLKLVCPNKHEWETEIDGISYGGAVYKVGRCPECKARGKRLPFTPEEFDNRISQQMLNDLGEDTHPIFALILSAIFLSSVEGHELDPLPLETVKVPLTVSLIALRTFETPKRTMYAIQRAEAMGLLVVEPTNGRDTFRFSLGPNFYLGMVTPE